MAVVIILAIVLLIGIIPLGVRASYDEVGAVVRMIVGPIHLTLFPKNVKKKASAKTAKKGSSTPAPQKKGGDYKEFVPLLQLVLDLLLDLKYKIRVNNLVFKLILAGTDPCDLAVNYGRAWAAVGNVMPQLERAFIIKKRDVEVGCDFCADNVTVVARADITISVARLLWIGIKHGFPIIKEYMRVMNIRKGGANV